MVRKIQGSCPLLEILQKIKSFDPVESYTIQRLINEETVNYIKIKVLLKNGTTLFIKDFVSTTRHKYSYHWQNKAGKLIRRWDNAPHGGKKTRLKDHCHVGTKVIPVKPVTIDDVLKEIRVSAEVRRAD